MQEVLLRIERVAPSATAVLITGESGTGKDLAARTMHEWSPRASRPFVAVNCSALPEGTLQSELFGHERGAFTSAHIRRRGRFELAHRGTIFLDEIGHAPLSVQTALLRVLEERVFERVGGAQSIRSDVRIVAATNRDLLLAIQEGSFREDLFYRLSVFPVHMPALREHPVDIPDLARFFAGHFGDGMQLADDAVGLLCEQPWPGNVRQLANFVERLCVGRMPQTVIDAASVRRELALGLLESNLALTIGRPRSRQRFEEREREALVACLEDTRWNVSCAARRLGLTRSAMRYRMAKYGLR